jgi:AraC-like DNA-binding protein
VVNIKRRGVVNLTGKSNSYRIEMAKEILNSPDYNKLTIDAIAEKAGFNSKSPFYIAFKKHTGMTPKVYLSMKN